jgi:2-phosphosulfolactate phosphatase
MPIDVYFLPDWTSTEEFADRTVIVIDILRATTTITQALAAGATEVIPCLEVEDACHIERRYAAPPELERRTVLGGERGGCRIEGFQLGNSPAEYTKESVGGKTVLFTTTNGTRAMHQCRQAKRVLLGAFNNLSAVMAAVRGESDVALLCAGTNGRVTSEDVLFAGAVVHSFVANHSDRSLLNDEAILALDAWERLVNEGVKDHLVDRLRQSRGGRNLVQLGMFEDIAFAAQIDTTSVVAELNLAEWRIHPMRA